MRYANRLPRRRMPRLRLDGLPEDGARCRVRRGHAVRERADWIEVQILREKGEAMTDNRTTELREKLDEIAKLKEVDA